MVIVKGSRGATPMRRNKALRGPQQIAHSYSAQGLRIKFKNVSKRDSATAATAAATAAAARRRKARRWRLLSILLIALLCAGVISYIVYSARRRQTTKKGGGQGDKGGVACKAQTDCAATEYCQRGVCQSKLPRGSTCEEDFQCTDNLCLQSKCSQTPLPTNKCPVQPCEEGLICNEKTGACVSSDVTPCNADGTCADATMRCGAGNVCVPKECTKDTDCVAKCKKNGGSDKDCQAQACDPSTYACYTPTAPGGGGLLQRTKVFIGLATIGGVAILAFLVWLASAVWMRRRRKPGVPASKGPEGGKNNQNNTPEPDQQLGARKNRSGSVSSGGSDGSLSAVSLGSHPGRPDAQNDNGAGMGPLGRALKAARNKGQDVIEAGKKRIVGWGIKHRADAALPREAENLQAGRRFDGVRRDSFAMGANDGEWPPILENESVEEKEAG